VRAAVIVACLAATACGEEVAAPPAVPSSAPASEPSRDGDAVRPDWVGVAPPPADPAPSPVVASLSPAGAALAAAGLAPASGASPLLAVAAPGDVAARACDDGTLGACAAACTRDGGDACTLLGRRICREGSVQECAASCDGGNAEACFSLAHVTAAGARVPRDAGRTRALLERACDGGVMAACWSLGAGRQYHSFPGAEGRRPSLDAFERACDLARAASQDDSGAVAWSLLLDRQYHPDATRDVAALMKEDDHEYAAGASCNVLAHAAPARAARLFEKHCATPATAEAAKVPAACDGLVDLAPDRALPYVGPRCSGGDEAACALVVRAGDARPRLVDAPLETTALRRLCDGAAARKETPEVDWCGRLKDMGASP